MCISDIYESSSTQYSTSVRIIAASESYNMKDLVELNSTRVNSNQIQNFDSEVVLLLCYCET